MDKEQKKRITSNITFLKERLAYLDPIIDRLVDKGIFTYEQKERIDKVTPPTPHKRFNEFIQMLLSSLEPNCFQSFIQCLEEERYYNIVEKLCKDGTYHCRFPPPSLVLKWWYSIATDTCRNLGRESIYVPCNY